jgi:hypothetical protein
MAVRLPYGVRKCHYRKGNVTIKDLLEGLQGTYGVLTLIVLIGLAGAAGKWVWGWTYQECKAREQEWRGDRTRPAHGRPQSDRHRRENHKGRAAVSFWGRLKRMFFPKDSNQRQSEIEDARRERDWLVNRINEIEIETQRRPNARNRKRQRA